MNLLKKFFMNPEIGYYTKKIPFGKEGDFVTAPTISNLFSEIITIWLISCWEKFGKPKSFNFVELGPGDGSFSKVLIDTIKNFPDFKKSIKIFLYEKSDFLKKIQKKNNNKNVKWINNFKQIKKGPVVFFGNEFFDAIPIKQFTFYKKDLFEKCYIINKKTGLNETYYKSFFKRDIAQIKSFKTFKKFKIY